MNALAGGQLQIDVRHDGERIRGVNLSLERPVGAVSQLMAGRPPMEVLELIPMLFSICANAHRIAGGRALEQALKLMPSPDEAMRQEQLLAIERFRESLLRLGQGWRYPLQTPSAERDGVRCTAALAKVLQNGESTFDQTAFNAVLFELRHWWQAARCSPQQEQQWLDSRFERWRSTELGDAVPVLEPCLTSSLIAAMERETGGEFCSAPKLDGQCRHAGVATVAANVHNAKAVLTDSLKALLSQMEQGLTQLESPVLAGTIRPYAGRPGVGYGWARSARGWLLHRVELVKEHVARWQILAPTDWNFHTDGIVAKRLTGVRVARESAEALVGDLILSLDPCVEFEVRVKDA